MSRNPFEDTERTPKATQDGLQEGRPHPQLRKYAAHYDKVDYATAMMRLQMRRSGEMPLIKGGVDDGSPEMEVSDSLFDVQGHVVVDPKASVQRAPQATADPPHSVGPGRVPTREELLRSAPGSVEASVDLSSDPFPVPPADPGRYDPFSGDRFVPEAPKVQQPRDTEEARRLREENSALRSSVERLKAQLAESRESMKPVQDSLEEYRRSYEEMKRTSEGLASEVKSMQGPFGYLNGRKRLSVSANGMSFSVPAISVEESFHGVLALMPSSGDGMTFTPDPMTEVDLGWDGVSEILSFCTSFELPGLGARALVFLRRPGDVADRRKEDPYNGQSASDLVRKLVAS